MVKKILAAVAVVVLGFIAFVASRPGTYHVERTQTIHAPADVVFAQLDDFHAWAAWSPWEKLDSSLKKTYEGTPGTVGASYAWQGSRQVGKGQMTITEHEAPTHLGVKLDFIEPFKSTAKTDFRVVPAGDAVNVTWSMEGQNGFVSKLFQLFVDMDTMIGRDYEKGLSALSAVAEAEAKKRAEEAAAAAEKARAEAAAAQAAAAPAAAPAAAAPPAAR